MPQNLVIGVEDKGGNDRLAGKQGYGNARGIWQTVYLEARGNDYIDYVHFTPDIDRSAVKVQVGLNGVPAKDATIRIKFKNGEQTDFTYQPKGKAKKSTVQEFEIPLSDQRLWELDDPYLYETTVSLYANGQPAGPGRQLFRPTKNQHHDAARLGLSLCSAEQQAGLPANCAWTKAIIPRATIPSRATSSCATRFFCRNASD